MTFEEAIQALIWKYSQEGMEPEDISGYLNSLSPKALEQELASVGATQNAAKKPGAMGAAGSIAGTAAGGYAAGELAGLSLGGAADTATIAAGMANPASVSSIMPEAGMSTMEGTIVDTLATTDPLAGVEAFSAAEPLAATTALDVLGGIGGAYGLYTMGDKWGRGDRSLKGAGMSTAEGALYGAMVGNAIPGVGTLAGGVAGGLYGLAGSMIKTGKHKDQKKRDAYRSFLQEQGVIGDDYSLSLADGSRWDMGKDGGFRLSNSSGGDRGAYDVDFSNPLAGQTVSFARPLGLLVAGADKKGVDDMTGYFTNAALSNSKDQEGARQNLLSIWNKYGITEDEALNALKGTLDEKSYGVAAGQLKQLLSGQYEPLTTEEINSRIRSQEPTPIPHVPGAPVPVPRPTPSIPKAWNPEDAIPAMAVFNPDGTVRGMNPEEVERLRHTAPGGGAIEFKEGSASEPSEAMQTLISQWTTNPQNSSTQVQGWRQNPPGFQSGAGMLRPQGRPDEDEDYGWMGRLGGAYAPPRRA